MEKTRDIMEIEMAEIKNELKHLSKNQDELKIEVKETMHNFDVKFDNFIQEFRRHAEDEKKKIDLERERIDKKLEDIQERNKENFADKKVETAFWYVVAAFGSAIIGGLWYLLTHIK